MQTWIALAQETIMIRLSWVKYIWASIGLCSVWVGVSDGRLDLLVLGLILTPILWLSGYGFERFQRSRKRANLADTWEK